MDMKNNGSAYKRIKGFTLVELIVVIAIISILAGVINLATQGFIRNARRETANDNARLLFTGFQDILTQCEIKQDNSTVSPTFTNDTTLTNIVIQFKAYNGEVQSYVINGMGTGVLNSDYTGSMVTTYKDVTADSKKSKLPAAIANIIDNSFEGEASVYIDYVNFEVKSVVFKPMTDGERNNTYVIDTSDLDANPSGYGLSFENTVNQEAKYDNAGKLYGVYPFWDNMI